MILFLDFDGVLHPKAATDDELFCRAPLLWGILHAAPAVDVVFATSWRFSHPLDVLVRFVTSGGGEDLAGRFIGCTPKWETEPGAYIAGPTVTREKECRLWIEGQAPGRAWLALDDEPVNFREDCPAVHYCDPKHGLTPADCEAILRAISNLGNPGLDSVLV